MKKPWQKFFLLILISFLLFAWSAGCSPQEEALPEEDPQGEIEEGYPMTITDLTGREVVIEKEPQSIVSLRPSTTETLFALGLGERVTGVTEFCYYPPEAAEKEKIGDFATNVEKIVSLDPDLVFTFQQEDEAINALINYGYPVVDLKARDLEEVMYSIELVGRITGTQEKAEELTANISRDIEEIKEYTRDLEEEEKPTVFVMIDTEQLYTAGDGTFLNEVISAAGGVNIGARAGSDYFVISEEMLFQEDPDYILCTFHMRDKVMERENWQDLKALKNDQVYDVDDDLVSRPGPRVAQGISHIFEVIHPQE